MVAKSKVAVAKTAKVGNAITRLPDHAESRAMTEMFSAAHDLMHAACVHYTNDRADIERVMEAVALFKNVSNLLDKYCNKFQLLD